MELGGFSTDYTKYLASSGAAAATKNQISGVADRPATEDEMMDACKQFEEYLIEMVMDEVVKNVNLLGMGEATSAAVSTSQDFLKDGLVQEMASRITESGNLGIAQKLYDSMKRSYDIPQAESMKNADAAKS